MMITAALENLLSKADLLIVFGGMAILLSQALMALRGANSENATLAQLLAKLMVAPETPAPSRPVAPPSPAAPQPATAKPAPPAAVIDQGLVDAVKKFEGFQAHAYGDFKQYSIGYGTKATGPDEAITQAEAEKRLMAELAVADGYVEKFAPNAPIGVKQALTSLTYNAGPLWEQQSLGQLIKAGSYEEAKSHFLAYNHAGGAVNAGLTARREAEVKWFDNPL